MIMWNSDYYTFNSIIRYFRVFSGSGGYVWICALVAAIGGVLFGYDAGRSSLARPAKPLHFHNKEMEN